MALPPDEFTAIHDRTRELLTGLPPQVRLIGVSKTFSADHIRAAYAAGLRDFGENRVQEAIAKQDLLSDLADITWHLIGQLQSNKIRKAVAHFDWIHSVDSLPQLERINAIAAETHRTPNLCLQVKFLPDANKTGWSPETLIQSLPQIVLCNSVHIKGLMTIPPNGLSPQETLEVFCANQRLANEIAHRAQAQNWANLPMEHLSMGMSADYALALKAGATFIRLGRTLFGNRRV